jgi:hypothetical protein
VTPGANGNSSTWWMCKSSLAHCCRNSGKCELSDIKLVDTPFTAQRNQP